MTTLYRWIWLVSLCCMAVGVAPAADEFPYDAFVAVDSAEVVAGPGHRFYATQRLERGTKIEIFREEPSGWLAIRPPDGAFSWTPAESIERSPQDQKVGRVKASVASWIGTAMEHVTEHRQQVTLKPGEVVQILGEKSVAGNEGKQEKWLKIAPPAGEFRWIHLRDVSRQRPEPKESAEALIRGEGSEEELAEQPLETTASDREAEERREPTRLELAGNAIALRDIAPLGGRRDSRVEPTQFRGSRNPPEAKPASPDGFVARKRRSGDATAPEPAPTSGQRSTAAASTRPRSDSADRTAAIQRPPARPSAISLPADSRTVPNTGLSPDEIARQLDQVDTELSLMLAQDKSLWNLADLRQRTEQLVERGADPAGRGRARLMLDKIKQFEGAFDVDEYGPIRTNTKTPVAGNTPVTNSSNAAAAADPRYDAKGWLKPVISRKGDKPVAPYAVVDQDGKPICFITPSPGLNLQSYVNKQVGVYGRRGYLEELKKSHLTAERVIDLDRQWR